MSARTLIRAWLPKSLLGRLILVMFGGLLLAQIGGGLIMFQIWDRQAVQHQGRYLGQRIVEIQHSLSQFPPAQRPLIINALNSPRLHVELSPQGPPNCGGFDSDLGLVENLRRQLEQQLAAPLPCLRVRSALGGQLSLQVALPLRDGTWLYIEHSHQNETNFAWPWRLSLNLLLMLGLISLLSWFAVRWFTRPLSDLANAAEQLGRDIQQPPLEERGAIEVRRATRAFNTMQARLRRYLDDRTRILSAVSHDLKTPLTRLRLRAELIEDEELRASLCRDLEEMQAMTLATLDFLRGLDDRETAQKVDVMALLSSLQADAEELGWAVSLEENPALPPCHLRVNSIKRCLNNLLENGVKYGQAVHIRAYQQDREMWIDISDQGTGIPQEALESVFEPFFRLEDSRSRQTGGTGLGLSIARNLARAQGGEVELHNRPEGGLLARLRLALSG